MFPPQELDLSFSMTNAFLFFHLWAFSHTIYSDRNTLFSTLLLPILIWVTLRWSLRSQPNYHFLGSFPKSAVGPWSACVLTDQCASHTTCLVPCEFHVGRVYMMSHFLGPPMLASWLGAQVTKDDLVVWWQHGVLALVDFPWGCSRKTARKMTGIHIQNNSGLVSVSFTVPKSPPWTLMLTH